MPNSKANISDQVARKFNQMVEAKPSNPKPIKVLVDGSGLVHSFYVKENLQEFMDTKEKVRY